MNQQHPSVASAPVDAQPDLLRIYDHLCNAASLSLALEMAIGRVMEEQQRAALEALAGQVVDILEDIKTAMKSRETISSLFLRWAANPDARAGYDYSGKSQEQLDAIFADCTSLQQRITDAVPTTAGEVAQQIIAATDDGACDMPGELFDRLREMARRAAV